MSLLATPCGAVKAFISRSIQSAHVAVAQLVEHQISTLRVASSILVSDSKYDTRLSGVLKVIEPFNIHSDSIYTSL